MNSFMHNSVGEAKDTYLAHVMSEDEMESVCDIRCSSCSMRLDESVDTSCGGSLSKRYSLAKKRWSVLPGSAYARNNIPDEGYVDRVCIR
jgi:hypothetical protein